MALQPRPDGALVYVAGSTRSGKTLWTAQRTERDRRALAWDSKDEWSARYGFRRVTSLRELCDACKPGAPVERVAFVPMLIHPDVFNLFCRLAWVWLRVARGSLIVEELADVTSPGKAPLWWGNILRKGVAYGPTIYALTQRPAESDKTALGNATLLHCHQMASADDEKYMARHLRCEPAQVAQLRPLHYIERDRISGEQRHGKVTIKPIRLSK
jgi:hypothetical protein